MATDAPSGGRLRAAPIALAGAALIALAALGVRLIGGGEEAPVANAAAPAAPDAARMVSDLMERLRRDPDNHEGWHLLGLALRDQGRFVEAGQAFRRAMELSPRNADYAAYLGEMLILAADAPPPEAETLFRRALELQPGHPQARYYLATLRDLRGDHRGALDELVALLRDAPPGAPWAPQVRGAAEAIARQNNIDLAGRLPPPAAAATDAIPGPTAEQMAAARAIPPSQQDEMVRGMVDRLAARLRQNPRDAEGWIRLMRSRMVLNEPDAARQALASAVAAHADDPPTQARLRQAARQLAVPGA